VLLDGEDAINRIIEAGDDIFTATCLSMGNPHAVVFCDDIDSLDLSVIGPKFADNPLFPESVNAEFVNVVDRNRLKMRAWERGNAETMACGTCACAAAVAAVQSGWCDRNEDIRVRLKGGELIIKYMDDGAVWMTGDCKKVYEGTVEI